MEFLRRLEQGRALALGTGRQSRHRGRRAYSLIALLVACGSKEKPPPPAKTPTDAAVAIDAPAARLVITPAAKTLPGVLYFTSDGHLARLEDGVLTTDYDDVGADVFPGHKALPDGRLVGIASKGNGEAGSEQLILIGPGQEKKIERIGPSMTQVRNPTIDPDGKWIAIEGRIEPNAEIYRIDLSTQGHTRLTNNKQGNFMPAALDAKTIVFTSSRDGDSELYRMTIDGKQVKRLTAFHRDDFFPRIAPDGKTIAFVSDREGPPRICLIAPDGTSFRRLTKRTDGEENLPVWSPDGKSIAFLNGQELWLHTDGADRLLAVQATEPAFSPDGKWLVYAYKDLWAVPTGGGDAVQLTSGQGIEFLARWVTK